MEKGDLIVIPSQPSKRFHHEYLLFIPKGVTKNRPTYLLVEPNNTGKTTDSISIHKQYAVSLATESSVGNNISTELKIPLLVPVFPRPAIQPLMYTHALDRDVILEQSESLKRLDLQLIEMIKDAKKRLKKLDILVQDKVFMNGFSASATFTNRFLFLHPEYIKAAAMGGLNGALMLPLETYNNNQLNYPLGLSDFEQLFGEKFDRKNYNSIPQYIYMGGLDDNDAVQFDDAYSLQERQIINTSLGHQVQDRWKTCQSIYTKHKLNTEFKTYKEVGHWTTSEMNLNTILFFLKHLKTTKL